MEEIYVELFIRMKNIISQQLNFFTKGVTSKSGVSFTGIIHPDCSSNVKITSIKDLSCHNLMIFNWTDNFLATFCEEKFNYKHIRKSKTNFKEAYFLDTEDPHDGCSFLIKQFMQLSATRQIPEIIPRCKADNDIFSLSRIFIESRSSHIINICMKILNFNFMNADLSKTNNIQRYII